MTIPIVLALFAYAGIAVMGYLCVAKPTRLLSVFTDPKSASYVDRTSGILILIIGVLIFCLIVKNLF